MKVWDIQCFTSWNIETKPVGERYWLLTFCSCFIQLYSCNELQNIFTMEKSWTHYVHLVLLCLKLYSQFSSFGTLVRNPIIQSRFLHLFVWDKGNMYSLIYWWKTLITEIANCIWMLDANALNIYHVHKGGTKVSGNLHVILREYFQLMVKYLDW